MYSHVHKLWPRGRIPNCESSFVLEEHTVATMRVVASNVKAVDTIKVLSVVVDVAVVVKNDNKLDENDGGIVQSFIVIVIIMSGVGRLQFPLQKS